MRQSFRIRSWAVALVLVAVAGCSRPPAEQVAGQDPKDLPPAYPQNQITEPRLLEVADGFKAWALAQRAGKPEQPLYQRVEVLPPAQTVQPYGVGAYQQEPRLPVILTTGPGWNELRPADREERAAAAFKEITARLAALKREPALQPTLTIQTPQGLELGWINHLDPSGKNLHGD
jgi:hypothetical protein